MSKVTTSLPLLFFAFSLLQSASAVDVESNVIQGAAYSIGNGFTTGATHPEGSHFHSSNLAVLPPGNPPIFQNNAAEVGGFFGDEEVRGAAEFHIDSGVAVEQAVLFFEVFDLFEAGLSPEISGVDGLFGQGPLDGVVDVFPYIGDDNESFSDYQAPTITDDPILSIVVDETVLGGETFSVDITSIYNDLAAGGDDLGIRLQMADPDPDAGAITFTNFRVEVQPVPEPSSALMTFVVAWTMLYLRRRR